MTQEDQPVIRSQRDTGSGGDPNIPDEITILDYVMLDFADEPFAPRKPPRASASMSQPPRKRLLSRKRLVYILIAALALAVAAGVGGATAAIMMQRDLSSPESKEPRASGQQGNTPQHQGAVEDRSQQKEAGAEQGEAASQQAEAEYVSRVGEIQANSVETFLYSHGKLLRYDTLSADNVEEMRINKIAFPVFTTQVNSLDPPQKYREHYEVFRLAINELKEATHLAYTLAADPTAATQSGFDDYDTHVEQAATYLKKSNEMLGRDYKTIEGVQRSSPFS